MDKQGRIVIVYLIDFLATRDGVTGGTERQLIETINHLDRSKFRPFLMCLREFKRSNYWEALSCEKQVINVYSLSSLKSFLSIVAFARFLRKNRVDIVQSFFFDSILFGILGAKLANVRIFISCRRDMGFWHDKKLVSRLRFVNRFTTKLLANSNAVKHYTVQHEKVPEELVDVIYNGVNLEAVDQPAAADLSKEFVEIAENDAVVGIVANFNREVKRVDLFIQAAAEVSNHMKNVRFLIVGEGKLKNELAQLAFSLGLEEVVIFAGKKENAISYIKSFDIGVLTSDSEGFSNVVLEYMAAGIPAVTTKVGGNSEIIKNGHSGVLVPRGDYKAFAREIRGLLSDRDRRIRIGKEARRVVEEKYTLDTKIREIECYYWSLCQH